MSQRVPTRIWLVTLFCAVVLGIVPGIALPQNTITTAIPLLLGWLALPVWFALPGIDYVTHIPEWLGWLVRLYYPLAMLLAFACAYWTMRSTERRRKALLVVGSLACVSVLVSIPVSLFAPSLNSNGIISGSAGMILPVWLNLLFSAGLGWCIGCLLFRSKRRIIVASRA